jgi:hypothetical protein
MSEYVSDPLLALVKERNLIDDLQYEEIVEEHNRTGNQIGQILQDFELVDLDTQLQIKAEHLGTEVVDLNGYEVPQDALDSVPADTAQMYKCLPVALHGSVLQLALSDPLNPATLDELGFTIAWPASW